MAMSLDELAAREPIARWEEVWGGENRLSLSAYAGDLDVPEELVTSVRGVVSQGDRVLLMRSPDDLHIVPGGRREPGERYIDTLRREVHEETGWEVNVIDLLGVMHFRHLTPMPEGYRYPYPDFLHLIYGCTALSKTGVEDREWDVPVGFKTLEELEHERIRPAQLWFARALLEHR